MNQGNRTGALSTLENQKVCYEGAIALEGNGCRPSHQGSGINDTGASFTLNHVEQHGVAYGIDQQGGKGGANSAKDVSPAVLADSHGTPHGVAYDIGNGQATEATIAAKECCQTLNTMHDHQAVCFENHAQDSRVRPIEVSDTRNQKDGTGGNNLPLVVHRSQVPFVKTSHARGKGGIGEKWERCEVAGTRNAIEGADGRNQECVVSTNSNGGDVAPTLTTELVKRTGAQQATGGGYVISRKVDDRELRDVRHGGGRERLPERAEGKGHNGGTGKGKR